MKTVIVLILLCALLAGLIAGTPGDGAPANRDNASDDEPPADG